MVDNCNYGESEWCDIYSYLDLVYDFVEVIEVEFGKIDLLGYLMGGKVVMMLVLICFDFVNCLIVVDIVFVIYIYS